MNYEAIFRDRGSRSLSAGLVGVGDFGAPLLGQARAVPGLRLGALCDRDVERVARACRNVGLDQDDIRICEDPKTAAAAYDQGTCVIVPDSEFLMTLPLDVVVEATGDPAAGARTATAAIAAGKHVVMVTKETDLVVGPLLHRKARDADVTYTVADGDQPSLLIGLVSWARLLGLPVTAAGKASEYDIVYEPTQGTVTAMGRTLAVDGFEALWPMPPDGVSEALAQRAEALSALPPSTVPDLCEMGIVANATGLLPDKPELHAPVARTVELPEIFRPVADGGILARAGSVDIFNCLRRDDELSFAGGVFVVVECRDRKSWHLLGDKGVPVSRSGGHALLHNPVHLLGIEAPVSILSACVLGVPTGGLDPRPRCDLVARTTRPLSAGTLLGLDKRHAIAETEPLLLEARPARGNNPVPYYLAAGNKLAVDMPTGTILTCDIIEPPADRILWQLRAEQDDLFLCT